MSDMPYVPNHSLYISEMANTVSFVMYNFDDPENTDTSLIDLEMDIVFALRQEFLKSPMDMGIRSRMESFIRSKLKDKIANGQLIWVYDHWVYNV